MVYLKIRIFRRSSWSRRSDAREANATMHVQLTVEWSFVTQSVVTLDILSHNISVTAILRA